MEAIIPLSPEEMERILRFSFMFPKYFYSALILIYMASALCIAGFSLFIIDWFKKGKKNGKKNK